ncbi:MAG TPA: hypothetical protein EYQ84_03370 [Nitrospinaceae bacterium]|nr:hypothetical protein [Nitrospinaceae bacterium]
MNVLEQYDDGKRYNSNGNWWYVDKECKHEGCHTLIDSCDNEYTYHGGLKSHQQILWCKKHYRSLASGRNDRTNAISALVYKRAGGEAEFYKLPEAIRILKDPDGR